MQEATNEAVRQRRGRGRLADNLAWRGRQMKRNWQLYALIFLPVVYIIVFKYVPMYGAQIAFKHYVATKGIFGSEWVGFEHFVRFFKSYQFTRVLRNSLVLSFYGLAAGFPLPIILALSLHHVRNRFFQKTVQMVTYAPHFISTVVIVGILMQFLSPRVGIVNELRTSLGAEPINFFGSPGYFWHIFVWSDVWQNVGFGCIIYLAALSGIDPTLHEAATIDGATKFQRIRHIDIPGIVPIAVILLILSMGNTLDIGFEKAFLMQNNLNLRTSEVIETYVYKVGLTSQVVNFSYASAIGIFKSVVGLILLVMFNRIARKVGDSSLW